MKFRMLCLALLCFSQTYAQFTNPLDAQMVALTQNLNFTEVTSGILFDRGIQTAKPVELECFDNIKTILHNSFTLLLPQIVKFSSHKYQML